MTKDKKPAKTENKPSAKGKQTNSRTNKVRKPPKDPFAKREAQKYQQPVASRELILKLVSDHGKPIAFTELIDLLDIQGEDEERFVAVKRRLKAMLRDGQLVQNRRGAYGLPEKMDLIKGRVSATASGFGFLIPDDGGDDLFLSPGQMKALFDGDIILAKVSGIDRRGRKEGRVVDILERNTHEVVGRCFVESGVAFLQADNKKITNDILLVDFDKSGATKGQLLVAEIVTQPSYRNPALARVTEVLGEHMAPGMEVELAIRSHQIPYLWPEGIEEELVAIPDQVVQKDIRQRVDLRDLNFVTIDGEDARDFDDAVYCESRQDGWLLYVAVADVANYVKNGSALDKEAVNRGNSVYFPQRVIPMLPEKLSNGLCSLNPHLDRLTMVCEMQLDRQGKLKRYRFMEACIHSKARLTYTEVAAFLEEGEVSEAISPVIEDISTFYQLFRKLRKIREQRGALDIDSTESRFIFNDNKKIESVVPVVRNMAHLMIEEAMLITNTCAAHFLQHNSLPALYRVHDAPSEEKLADLKDYLQPLGFRFSGKAGKDGDISPAHFQEAIAFASERPDKELINTIVLRSMQQAVYSEECRGHFGLAYDHYAHFTSPIRRYPDLIVHRAIKYFIRSNLESKQVKRVQGTKVLKKTDMLVVKQAELQELGQHLSLTERRADLATRDAMDWLKCEFMLDKVGECFEGKISSVTPFGLFVLLNEYYVEGLVHISDLKKDYYHYDERRHELQAERSKEVFRLADPVNVQVSRVSLEEKRIEFVLEGETHLQAFSVPKNKGKKIGKAKSKDVAAARPAYGRGTKKTGKAAAGAKQKTGSSGKSHKKQKPRRGSRA